MSTSDPLVRVKCACLSEAGRASECLTALHATPRQLTRSARCLRPARPTAPMRTRTLSYRCRIEEMSVLDEHFDAKWDAQGSRPHAEGPQRGAQERHGHATRCASKPHECAEQVWWRRHSQSPGWQRLAMHPRCAHDAASCEAQLRNDPRGAGTDQRRRRPALGRERPAHTQTCLAMLCDLLALSSW